MENRPTHNINQMMCLGDSKANVFPAFMVGADPPTVNLDLRQQPVRDMGILVQRQGGPFPDGEVGAAHAEVVGVAGNAVAVEGVAVAGDELDLQVEGASPLGGLPVGAYHGEPVADEVPGKDEGSGDPDGPDELGTEEVVVLHLEHQVVNQVC